MLSISRSRIAAAFPYIALVAGILALSISAMFIRWAKAPGPITGFYRVFFAVLILAPFFVARIYKNQNLTAKNIIFPILGGIASGCDLGLWTSSLSYTTASNATLIGNTAPLWVALVGLIWFQEKLQRDFWFSQHSQVQFEADEEHVQNHAELRDHPQEGRGLGGQQHGCRLRR